MLKVDVIEEGTVIDHIKAGKGQRVLEMLGIDENYPHRVAMVMNVPSKKEGKKDIVKIAGIHVTDEMANKIALVSSKATINIIKNSKVQNKYLVELPPELKGIGKCPNPNCVTNYSEAGDVKTGFEHYKEKYKCTFCERVFEAEELI
ncbi:aspartate carbamoyltransferase regulatory subunit [Candidatus Micrarchaeota archaeon]|nr:aspartate carbamoyltransferase regulatory subunit [Candidatus Micrarchaeota archaeon]